MKKTLTINLNGRVFNIDEDAYQLLDNYLKNLQIHFRKEDGCSEILADFEARIEELLSSRMRLGYDVINIEEVEKVIAQMGQPDEFGDEESDQKQEEKIEDNNEPAKKKLHRNPNDKMIAGIFSGIAAYFDWNVLAVRLIAILLILATSFWIIPIYLIAWLIIPEARTAEQKLQMQGKPITIENIGRTVAAESDIQNKNTNQGCLNSFLYFVVALFKISIIGLGIIIGVPMLFVLVIVIIALLATLFGVGTGLISSFFAFDTISPFTLNNPLYTSITFAFVIGIPVIILIYSIVSYFMKLKPVHTGVKWTGLIIWILALILFFTSGIKTDWNNFYTGFKPMVTLSKKNKSTIEGNGIIKERTEIYSLIDRIELDDILNVDLHIEQIDGNGTSILISGDSNLLDYIELDNQENGKIEISATTEKYLDASVPFLIRIQTPDLKGLKMSSAGKVKFIGAFHLDELFLNMEGAGIINADSLYINKLNVKSEGIGSVSLAGEAKKANFDLKGAGEINASQLNTDSVFARVKGIGQIKCDPVSFLEGSVEGIGKIRYKTEPKNKSASVHGIGKIGLE